MARLQRIRGWFQGPAFRKKVLPWLLILPALSIHLIVVIGPSLGAIYYSLTDWSGIGPAEYVGLKNFRTLLGDVSFRKAFTNNMIWLVFFPPAFYRSWLRGAAPAARAVRG